LRISWTEHRTNNSILEELEPARRFLAEVKRRKLQYFGHVVRPVAKNFQVGVLSLWVLGPGESEARRVEGDGVLGRGFTHRRQLGGQGSAVSSPAGSKTRLDRQIAESWLIAAIKFSAF